MNDANLADIVADAVNEQQPIQPEQVAPQQVPRVPPAIENRFSEILRQSTMKINRTLKGKRLITFVFLTEKGLMIWYMHENIEQIWQISFLH